MIFLEANEQMRRYNELEAQLTVARDSGAHLLDTALRQILEGKSELSRKPQNLAAA